MKNLISILLILLESSFVLAMSPGDVSSQQPSLLLSASNGKSKFVSLRVERSNASQEIMGQSNDAQSFNLTKTYSIQYAQYFKDRWMLGLQMGADRSRLPFYPNLNLQYDLVSGESWKISWGLMYGGLQSPGRYGTGGIGSYSLTASMKLSMTVQWISDAITYETSKDQKHENFVDVSSKYFLYLVGMEFLLPKTDQRNAQTSVILSLGQQKIDDYKVTYEEYPSSFKYHDGQWGYVDFRIYLD